MKCLLVSVAVSLASMSGGAIAACTRDSQVTGANSVTAVLQGSTVCAMRGADKWQEYHQAGGALIDYKKGPNDRVDPTKQVGSWSVTGNGVGTKVNYVYGPSERYSHTLHSNGGGGYSLCDGGSELAVTLRAGQGPCP